MMDPVLFAITFSDTLPSRSLYRGDTKPPSAPLSQQLVTCRLSLLFKTSSASGMPQSSSSSSSAAAAAAASPAIQAVRPMLHHQASSGSAPLSVAPLPSTTTAAAAAAAVVLLSADGKCLSGFLSKRGKHNTAWRVRFQS